MNILLVSFYYQPEIGAAPSRISNMARGLREYGASVDILTSLPNYPKGKIFDEYRHRIYKGDKEGTDSVFRYWTYATVSKNPMLRAWGMMSFALMMWMFAFKRKRIRNYDVIVVQSPPLFVSFSAIILFKCLYRKKVVLNVSDLWPLSAVELGAMRGDGIFYRLFSRIERFIYKNSDGILGQSEEILEHINGYNSPNKKFLYRNLQRYNTVVKSKKRHSPVKVVYAGLLGVAQDILSVVTNVDFKSMGIEFHIYGGGNQADSIKSYIRAHEDSKVFYHGMVSKENISDELPNYDASIVPLVKRIKGAVPSKIFDLLPMGLPIIFCGGGEGADIVKEYGLGFVSEPKNYLELENNLREISEMSEEAFKEMSLRCVNASETKFNFETQMNSLYQFLLSI